MAAGQQEVIELVRQHPEGIPVKKLAVSYNQKYKRNLTLSTLGFTSMPKFLGSMAELVVEDEVVFHRSHRINRHATTPAAPAASAAPPGKDPKPAIHTRFGESPDPPPTELTQEEQLLEKVGEVVRHYPVAATSIVQLQNSYFLHFGTPLPMSLYVPLYDRLTQKTPPAATSKPKEANGEPESLSFFGNLNRNWARFPPVNVLRFKLCLGIYFKIDEY